MMAAVIFSFAETGTGSAPINVFGKATAAAAMRESSKKRRRVGVSMVEGIRSFDGPSAMGRAQAGSSHFASNSAKTMPTRIVLADYKFLYIAKT
jgi:hypothetical protein